MKISRKNSIRIQYVLDQLVPPILRDSKIFMYLPMKLVFKDKASIFMNFKNTVFDLDESGFSRLYESTADVNELQGETDLNEECTKKILRSIIGRSTLEVGCGRGYLSNLLSKKGKTTAVDISISQNLKDKYKKVNFIEANIQDLPFKDNQFDTVVCTHTLEHVQDLSGAIEELRRVAKKKLIIVVPKQRPYKYTFSLHIHFFEYEWSLKEWFGTAHEYYIKDLGDWYYHETY